MKLIRRACWALVRAAALAAVIQRIAQPAARPLQRDRRARDAQISVVIPARNEAEHIAQAVASARVADGVGRVVVVDDGSTDETARRAADGGAEVVAVGEAPAGWAGKAWAVQTGVIEVGDGWVMSLDADATIEPELPPLLVQRALDDSSAVVSVAPHFAGGSAASRWMHASMLATFVYRFGRPGASDPPVVSGQCLVFDAERFLAWGGYAPVAHSPVEDVALARWLHARGDRVEFVDGGGLLRVKLNATASDALAGWGRSFGLPTVESVTRRLVDIALLTVTMVVPMTRAARGRCDLIDVASGAVRVGTALGLVRSYSGGVVSVAAAPMADPLALGALALSVARRTQRWRGRVYANR